MPYAAAIGAIGGSLISGAFNASNQRSDERLQREFAQKGIQWRVADAEKAGVHPLFALGANTHSFAPSRVGGQDYAALGQDIGRAIDARGTKSDRVTRQISLQHQERSNELSLQNMELQNTLLSSQINALNNQPAQPPPTPGPGDRFLIDGQGQTNTPLVETNPLQRTASSPLASNQEPGAIPEVGYTRTATGWAPVMSDDAKQRLEEDFFGNLGWQTRNRLQAASPNGKLSPPAEVPLKPGHKWVWASGALEYRQVPIYRWSDHRRWGQFLRYRR